MKDINLLVPLIFAYHQILDTNFGFKETMLECIVFKDDINPT